MSQNSVVGEAIVLNKDLIDDEIVKGYTKSEGTEFIAQLNEVQKVEKLEQNELEDVREPIERFFDALEDVQKANQW